MKRILFAIALFLIGTKQAFAICPICTIAVGSGLGVMRAMGVSDLLTGVWLGALIISSILWCLDWMSRKNIHFKFKKTIIYVGFYALFLLPLSIKSLWDNLLIATAVGTVVFLFAVAANKYLKRINDGKVVFYYQKVVIPVVFLIITNVVTYLLIQIF